MFPMLILSSFAGVPVSEAVVDHLVSKRTVVVHRGMMLDVVLCKGDPLGSREDGTLKVLAQPKLSTLHKQACSYRVGNTDGSGIGVEFLTILRLDGKIYLECDTQLSKKSPTKVLLVDGSFAVATDTQTIKTNVVLTPGKPFKVRLSSRSAEDQTWMEVTATVVENMPQVMAAEAAKMTWTVTDTQMVTGIRLTAPTPVAPPVRTMTPTFLQPQPPVLPASYFVPSVPMMMPNVVPSPTPPTPTPPPAISK